MAPFDFGRLGGAHHAPEAAHIGAPRPVSTPSVQQARTGKPDFTELDQSIKANQANYHDYSAKAAELRAQIKSAPTKEAKLNLLKRAKAFDGHATHAKALMNHGLATRIAVKKHFGNDGSGGSA